MKNVVVCNMLFSDIKDVSRINYKSWLDSYSKIIPVEDLSVRTLEKIISKWEENFFEKKALVAKVDDVVIGYCTYIDNKNYIEYDCELDALYIDLNYREYGVGSLLLENVISIMKKANKKTMLIRTLKLNENAIKFYSKNGGEIDGQNYEFDFLGKTYNEIGFKFNL